MAKQFMSNYDPRKELAPRDIVSRAIAQELLSRKENHVLLDATGIKKDEFLSHFPMIHETCTSIGIDPMKEWNSCCSSCALQLWRYRS